MTRFATYAILTAALCLAGCATTPVPSEPIVRTVEAKVLVDDPACARKAQSELVDKPAAYPDSDEALREAPNLFERVKLLLAGRELREARETALNRAIKECAK